MSDEPTAPPDAPAADAATAMFDEPAEAVVPEPKPVGARKKMSQDTNANADAETLVTLKASVVAKLNEKIAALEAFKAEADAAREAALEAERKSALAKLADKEGAAKALEVQAAELKAKLLSEQAAAQALVDKIRSEAEAAVAEKARLAAELDAEYLAEKKANFVAAAKQGRRFVSESAEEQVNEILSSRFEVSRAEDRKVVGRDRKTGKFIADVVPSLMDSPEFAHFLAPASTGGAGKVEGASRPVVKPEASAAPSGPDAVLAALIETARKKTQNRGPFAP